MKIHAARGTGCMCTPRELPNATADNSKVTCRSCLRLMLRNAERNAANWVQRPPEKRQETFEKIQRFHQRHGRTYRYASPEEALSGNLERAVTLRKQLGLDLETPVYQPSLSSL